VGLVFQLPGKPAFGVLDVRIIGHVRIEDYEHAPALPHNTFQLWKQPLGLAFLSAEHAD